MGIPIGYFFIKGKFIMREITLKTAEEFKEKLEREEKSPLTVKKYVRDVKTFIRFAYTKEISRQKVLEYKNHLLKIHTVRSVNSMLAALNGFFDFLGRPDLKTKSVKLQREVFCPETKELTRAEYVRLCRAAEKCGNMRLNLILQTLCATGIRISELRFVTVEAAKSGEMTVNCKAKTRTVFIIRELKDKLLCYAKQIGIKSGMIFVTRSGSAVDRTNIWREMKSLCINANVNPQKVFPHNLRHLFARVFYSMKKDIAKLADILGHSSIDTTRIYIISTGAEHRRCMESMHLLI